MSHFLVGLLSFFAGWAVSRLADRRALVRKVAENYIKGAQANRETQQTDEHYRLGLLHRSGGAVLRRREIERVCSLIAGHALRDPSEGVGAAHLLELFKWAKRENLDFGNQEQVLLFLAEIEDRKRGLHRGR